MDKPLNTRNKLFFFDFINPSKKPINEIYILKILLILYGFLGPITAIYFH